MLANLQTEWAALLMASLADAGVRDIVLSPGSRSTPFVIAAVREARLTRHEVIDERAAAFFALGQARTTGRPSVLLCTSGTAPAHYLPAMIEANITGTPLIVLSADRPHELYACRAPQTIDQVKLFGEHAREFFDLVPDASEGSLLAMRRIAMQAVLSTRWPRAGAVHVNARARKPLEPVAPTTDDETAFAARARAIRDVPMTFAPAPRSAPAPDAIARAAAIIAPARRGVIVAGPADAAQRSARAAIWELARTTGFPVAADATSQLRFSPKPADVQFLDGFELLLRSPTFRAKAQLDVAIQIGAPPTSGAWETVAPSLPRVVLAEHGWNDPHSNARVLVFGDVEASASALVAAVRSGRAIAADPERAAFMKAANAESWRAAAEAIAQHGAFVEASAVRILLDRTPADARVVVGNSLAVRLVDIYARESDRDLVVLSQRGASGIDGLVAGTAGAASTSEGPPTVLLIGDVSLLHDLTSLHVAARARTPIVVFVLNNGGGRIFEQLPLAGRADIEPAVLAHAVTPHAVDFTATAALFGIRHVCVSDEGETERALEAAFGQAGCTLIEARVQPSGAIALSRSVAQRVEAAVAAISTTRGT